jgi:hypothetical protein
MTTLHSQTVKALDSARLLLDGARDVSGVLLAEGYGTGWLVGLLDAGLIGLAEFNDARKRLAAEGARRRDWIAAAEQHARRACA